MRTKVARKWFIPYGTWVFLSHKEAHQVASSKSVDALLGLIATALGKWGALAAVAIFAQREVIHEKNKNSGFKGVKLLFVWATGMVMSIERLGKGNSPCC
jgi:hypothetical protein